MWVIHSDRSMLRNFLFVCHPAVLMYRAGIIGGIRWERGPVVGTIKSEKFRICMKTERVTVRDTTYYNLFSRMYNIEVCKTIGIDIIPTHQFKCKINSLICHQIRVRNGAVRPPMPGRGLSFSKVAEQLTVKD